jgi:predicted Abi (CAAX) family protease
MQGILQRLTRAILTLPTWKDWIWAIAMLCLYGLVYLPIGVATGFLDWQVQSSGWMILSVTAGALWMPGLTEELLFRVLLIPHPTEPVQPAVRWFWSCFGWVAFLLYHPFNIQFGAPVFFSAPVFLLGTGLLGILCTIAYLRSGSLWLPVVLHWLIVVVWLLLLGGLERFQERLS